MLDAIERIYMLGGGAALAIAALILAVWAKDRQLRAEHRERLREAKQTAVVLHSLLRRQTTREPMASLPDFGDDDVDIDTGIISVRNELEALASRELDSDIEALLLAYNRDTDVAVGRTPAETPKAKRRPR